jgi:hypothetical protein
MTRDFILALVLIGVGVIFAVTKQVSPYVVEHLLMLTRPGATILLLGSVLFGYTQGYHKSALIGGVLSITVLRALWTDWPRSDARRLHLEVGRDNARFDPSTSIDLQFGNGTCNTRCAIHTCKTMESGYANFPPFGRNTS